ncbi:nucleoside hydrolase [Caenimonas sedimenti]|uniref:Nucleoside hydrolase n=1 Tax=Caenimonas sedimenti TaxID=2596921 RepID=A0A562ZT38_9BURK|nr:nucleoside hydrolase [Caenimonas sedimenti]TWO71759.1 nucleoside hydrolase [Caenimonas sedimenti]
MTSFPRHDDAWYRARLADPRARPRVVIDTDTANEIDDQFALAWALLAPEALQVEAVYAEPFSFAHRRARLPHAPPDAPPFNPPDEGMRRSLQEILRVYALLGLPTQGRVLAGSPRYLPGPGQAVPSAAADHLVATARAAPADEPLYVLALGCVTNIASALLMAPDIVERIVVVWTSGYPSTATLSNDDSFNLVQDVAAAECVLDSGVPLVYLPGFHVGAQLRLSLAEVEQHVRGRGAIGDELHRLFTHNPLWTIHPVDTSRPYSWVIWDLICVAWLLRPAWVPSRLVPTPRLDAQRRWLAEPGRPLMREAHAVDRDAIFNDLFARLEKLRASTASAGTDPPHPPRRA